MCIFTFHPAVLQPPVRGQLSLGRDCHAPLKSNSLLLNMHEPRSLKAWQLCQICVDFDENCKRHILETKAGLLPAFMPLLQNMGVPYSFKEKITRIGCFSLFSPSTIAIQCSSLLPVLLHPTNPIFLGLLWLKFCGLKERMSLKLLNLAKTHKPRIS